MTLRPSSGATHLTVCPVLSLSLRLTPAPAPAPAPELSRSPTVAPSRYQEKATMKKTIKQHNERLNKHKEKEAPD